MKVKDLADRYFNYLLSDKARKRSEKWIIIISITSFLIHLAVIALTDLEIILKGSDYELLADPIAAIYTPFSFILLYEVYLLIYYLPQSITTYINKQYEIITLIVIRRIFKDLSKLDLTMDAWLLNPFNQQFLADIITTILLFFFIWMFNRKKVEALTGKIESEDFSNDLKAFIRRKKILAMILVPIFIFLAFFSLGQWFYEQFTYHPSEHPISDINSIFFNEFFTVLILTDVLLLLFSLFNTNQFHKVIRNSGFIISTILLRLSFSADSILNNILVLLAVLFGLLILMIHNQYERKLPQTNESTN